MGEMLLAGCIMVAFSIPAVLFTFLVARKAQLVIVMIASAFFWLLSLLISSIIWYIIPPIMNSSWAIIPVGTFFEELARYLFIHLYVKAERSFSVVSINAIVFPLTDLYSSLAAGIGFAVMHTFLFYGIILTHSAGPGALFSPSCPYFSTFVVAAYNAFWFTILHIALMVLGFDAYRFQSYWKMGFVFGLHMTTSCLTIANTATNGCAIGMPLVALVVLVAVGAAGVVIANPKYRSKLHRS